MAADIPGSGDIAGGGQVTDAGYISSLGDAIAIVIYSAGDVSAAI